ncbi:hypothetical protein MALG_02565 [Marinovum algicola DG 898]|nr:hypothetical protein MALG_02565 [Marinovum algicola DG 898]
MTLAIIVRASFRADSIEFVTPNDNDLQIGYMNRPEGHVIKAHRHLPTRRVLNSTQEVLMIRSGRIRVDFYDLQEQYLESEMLGQGDLIVLMSGGHGFKVIEPVDMVEVKQGPYVAAEDKLFFKGVAEDDVQLVGAAL